MQIERISDTKIKVMVNRQDVKSWNVTIKNMTDNTPEAQELFWYALKRAEHDLNFIVGRAQLLVEAIPEQEDGFVMFISKLKDGNDVTKLIEKSEKIKICHNNINIKQKKYEYSYIYKFKEFDDLCNAASKMFEIFYGQSKLYKYNNNFYLKLISMNKYQMFEIENVMLEFANKIKEPHIQEGILNEYGVEMIKMQAIEKISSYFV